MINPELKDKYSIYHDFGTWHVTDLEIGDFFTHEDLNKVLEFIKNRDYVKSAREKGG